MLLIRAFFAVALFVLFQTTYAQFEVVGKSVPFEEYQEGKLRVLSLKNGNTAVVYLSTKKAYNFEIRIYDTEYHLKVKKIIPATRKYKFFGDIDGVFETGGNITIIYNAYEDLTARIYRTVLNPENGAVISDEKVAELQTVPVSSGFAVAYGDVPRPGFFLRKDENSENYAIVLYNTLSSNRNSRIEVIHYNNKNQEISRAFNKSPEGNYKYIEFLDLVVLGDKEIIIATTGFNTKGSGGEQNGAVFVGSLKPGSNVIEQKKISYPKARAIEAGLIRFNHKTRELYMLTMENLGTKDRVTTYGVPLSIISSDLTTIKTKPVSTETIQAVAKSYKKTGFLAVPQNLFVNDDGSFSILYEGYETYYSGSITGCVLGDIGAVRYGKDGNEIGGAYVPKSYFLSGGMPLMYYSKDQLKAAGLYWGGQYKTFYYVDASNKGYILFNDIQENQERIEKKKSVEMIQGVGNCEAFFFDLSSNEMIPERQRIFDGEKAMAMFSAADYNKTTKTLVTVATAPRKKGENTRVVWIKVE